MRNLNDGTRSNATDAYVVNDNEHRTLWMQMYKANISANSHSESDANVRHIYIYAE